MGKGINKVWGCGVGGRVGEGEVKEHISLRVPLPIYSG